LPEQQTFFAKLFPEDIVFLLRIFDHLLLVPIDPTSQHG
jgi:hypothetical protein